MAKNDFDIDFDFEKEYGFDPKAILDSDFTDEDLDLSRFDEEQLGIDLSAEDTADDFSDFDLSSLGLDDDVMDAAMDLEDTEEALPLEEPEDQYGFNENLDAE